MRILTRAEALKDVSTVLDTATREPVRILQDGQDLLMVPAAEFEEAYELLPKKRISEFHEARVRVSEEARADGFTEDMLRDLLPPEAPAK